MWIRALKGGCYEVRNIIVVTLLSYHPNHLHSDLNKAKYRQSMGENELWNSKDAHIRETDSLN